MLIQGYNSTASFYGTLNGSLHTEDTATAFAADLRKRISQSQPTQNVETEDVDGKQSEATAKKQQMLDKLESSMNATVKYVSDKHGADAATAMMGVMYKSLGEGEVTEETLGEAYLDATRFIDRQFGIESGDSFMSHLNGQLNDSMNDFFDNGLSEQFISVTTNVSTGEVTSNIASQAVTKSVNKSVDDYAKSILSLIEQARANQNQNSASPYAQAALATLPSGVLADMTV